MPSFVVLLLLLIFSFPAHALADDGAAYAGDGECRFCHGVEARQHAASDHGRLVGARVGEGRACETCHGAGVRHIAVAGDPLYRGPLHIRTAEDLRREPETVCLSCHENGSRLHWHAGAHAAADVTCTGCHSIHKDGSITDCGSCHQRERARLQRSSHMPLREGAMQCADCHDPHGGAGPAALRAPSVNEVCYGCHADRRGPLLFEHLPVREDCTLCHDPHGSSQRSMLTKRPPLLCQQCHMDSGHIGRLYDGDELGNAAVSQFRGRGCLNCHSRIHGSNHPSGARFQR